MPTGHVIVTKADGVLETPPAEVDAIVEAIAERGCGVIHLHGGLVAKKKGLAIAESLTPVYEEAGAYPAFFVWSSGAQEIAIGNVLREIGDEAIFQQLVKLVLRFAVGKVREELGIKAVGAVPSEAEIAKELAEAEGQEPYAELTPSSDVSDPSHDDEVRIQMEIMQDVRLQGALQAALAEEAAADAQAKGIGAAGAPDGARRSHVDRDALAEVADGPVGARGLISTAALAKKALRILMSVISRFRSGRDHGVYLTVVEEVLRAFYLASAGGALWQMMKKETADTFASGKSERGGTYFLGRLAEALAREPELKISLVGHSTGAVFITNLLAAIEERRKDPDDPFPADFTFRHVVFLAPACTFTDFAKVLPRWKHLARDFRMFTMTDEAERRDALVPVVYPRSLLYFVSGVCERDADGRSEAAKPLVGLQRYYTADAEGLPSEVVDVRDFVAEEADRRAIWSPISGDPGFSSGAISHGAFDDDEEVRASLKWLLQEECA